MKEALMAPLFYCFYLKEIIQDFCRYNSKTIYQTWNESFTH
jgi:hypothetical protein